MACGRSAGRLECDERQHRLARALIKDIVADVDEEARGVVLTIHWRVVSTRNGASESPRPEMTEAATKLGVQTTS